MYGILFPDIGRSSSLNFVEAKLELGMFTVIFDQEAEMLRYCYVRSVI